ncbi:hypothetical protein CCACVL1_06970 [Corchorus capsularis]|uniref:Uncharacterized protein n=1 Tax=Corchorus capsularis TaxID=210143 RepID=A0A1R3JAS1_COCAP|nr:hypothetical protein CCACVL1_06970 [Corchorus capsularis]
MDSSTVRSSSFLSILRLLLLKKSSSLTQNTPKPRLQSSIPVNPTVSYVEAIAKKHSSSRMNTK